jgi:hypothetical protein
LFAAVGTAFHCLYQKPAEASKLRH